MNEERITITLPLHTPIGEVMDAWIAEAIQKAGTQLKAAYHLEMAPETISRRLGQRRKKQQQKVRRPENHQLTGAGDASGPLSPGGEDSP